MNERPTSTLEAMKRATARCSSVRASSSASGTFGRSFSFTLPNWTIGTRKPESNHCLRKVLKIVQLTVAPAISLRSIAMNIGLMPS